MDTAAIVFFSVLGGVFLMAVFVILTSMVLEHQSRSGMNDEERAAASDSWKAAKRCDRAGIRDAEQRLTDASVRRRLRGRSGE